MASWQFPLSYIPHSALVFATVHIITHYASRTSNASQSHPIFFLSKSSCQGYMQRALLLVGPGKRLVLFMLDRVLCCCSIECPSSTPTSPSSTIRGWGGSWLAGRGYYMRLTH